MRAYSYQRASSLADAARLLGSAGAMPLGGGTDLLPCIEDGIANPTALVDLRGIADSPALTPLPDGGLRISATARIQALSTDALVRDRYPALAQACASVGTPALRHMGTIGGNLCQRPRCWYFRRGIACLKNGGTSCPAKDGENQHLAIIDAGTCHAVHPSDPAVALLALAAEIETQKGDVRRRRAISELFLVSADREVDLEHGEFVTGILLPAASAGGKQLYRKLMQRGAWDFALASIAGVKRLDGSVRLAMGGIAPRPWRVPESVEEDVASGGLDEDSVIALAERALYDAKPLSKNAYKVALAQSLLRDAMRELAA